MKSLTKFIAVLAVAAVFLAPVAALANGGSDDNDGGGSTNTNTNTANGGTGGQGGKGGDGGNASVIGSGNSANHNTNTQGQGQKQKQSQLQGQGQKQAIKDSANNANNVSVDSGDQLRQAPPAFAPGLVAAPETCMGAVAVGASSPFGGVSFGTTYKSDDCELRMYARSLMAMGSVYYPAAVALLAQNPNVQKALQAAGIPIPGQKVELLSAPVASAAQLRAVAAVVDSQVRTEIESNRVQSQ